MIDIILTILGTVIYIIMGVGTAQAEMQVRSYCNKLDRITLVFWPIALIVWAFSRDV